MSIKSNKTTWPKFLLLFVVSIIGISVIHQEVKPISASASEVTLLTSFSSNTLVTASTYQSYQDDHWLLTTGGNNNGIGASGSYASKLALGSYSNLMSFDPSIISTSTYLTAVIAKAPFTHLSKISLSRGASNYAYSSTKAYLVKGSSLISDFSLVTIINEITTTLTDYSFPPITEDYYYAIVFYNPNGTYLLGDVNIHFYQQTSEMTYQKVNTTRDLYLGSTYTFVSETSHLVIGHDLTPLGFSSTSTTVTNNRIETNPNLLSFTLEVGTLINTYSLRLNNQGEVPTYLALDEGNQITTSETLSSLCAFSLTFKDDTFMLTSYNNLLLGLSDDLTFVFSSEPSHISLYRYEEEVNHQVEAQYFVDTLLTYSDHAYGTCESVYLYLDNLYHRLSDNAKSIIMSSTDSNYVLARTRMSYLASWVTTKEVKTILSDQKVNKQSPFIVMLILISSAITLYYITKPKRR